jgi:hypothetical protein
MIALTVKYFLVLPIDGITLHSLLAGGVMSQHLITQFINQSYVFKAVNGGKLVNHKLKKYQHSNRENNNSPEDIAESIHILKKITVQPKSPQQKKPQSQIDITV